MQLDIKIKIKYQFNIINGVMIAGLASSVVNGGFEPRGKSNSMKFVLVSSSLSTQ